jgi:hypothetical protein
MLWVFGLDNLSAEAAGAGDWRVQEIEGALTQVPRK